MTEYKKNNEGGVWENSYKKTNQHPDFTGNAIVNGINYKVSALKRDPEHPSRPAVKFLFTPKDAPKEPPKLENDAPLNDDIPF